MEERTVPSLTAEEDRVASASRWDTEVEGYAPGQTYPFSCNYSAIQIKDDRANRTKVSGPTLHGVLAIEVSIDGPLPPTTTRQRPQGPPDARCKGPSKTHQLFEWKGVSRGLAKRASNCRIWEPW
jgi:hypothetical protein